ncbi:uncharacterized protein LOC110625842 [Manihot esculenta]|uniref:uncharacterized protein LOC110625842 n=1 Tax=Manihot esculenta TaxID=3983 RepID=UPI001CC3FB45|nr:uncharacterized protein LOC110625842 [Manihot esculenta]
MSAVVCGSKRSFMLEDLPSPPVSKRLRCSSSSSSPVRFSPSPPLHQLRALFPHVDSQLLERALFQSSNDLDSAIKSLNEHCLESADHNSNSAEEASLNEQGVLIFYIYLLLVEMINFSYGIHVMIHCLEQFIVLMELHLALQCENGMISRTKLSLTVMSIIWYSISEKTFTAPIKLTGTLTNDGDATPSENTSVPNKLPVDGAEWVDLFVREMISATGVEDARARASRVLEILERSISKNAAENAAQSLQKENLMQKEHIEVLMRENSILKRAVSIQHERQKEFEDKHRELQQLVSQYQQQIKTLEMNNYALMMHLRQAQQSSPIPGRFHPDVF